MVAHALDGLPSGSSAFQKKPSFFEFADLISECDLGKGSNSL